MIDNVYILKMNMLIVDVIIDNFFVYVRKISVKENNFRKQ